MAGGAARALEAEARARMGAGRPVLGYGAGEPDLATPDYIVAAAQRACGEPGFHKYTPAAGLPEMRDAIAAETARDSGYHVERGRGLVTNGGKPAGHQPVCALLEPGDEVFAAAPYWPNDPEARRVGRRVAV